MCIFQLLIQIKTSDECIFDMIISADDYAAVCLKVARISDEDPPVKRTGPKNKTGKEMLQNVKVSSNFLKSMNESKRGYCSIILAGTALKHLLDFVCNLAWCLYVVLIMMNAAVLLVLMYM